MESNTNHAQVNYGGFANSKQTGTLVAQAACYVGSRLARGRARKRHRHEQQRGKTQGIFHPVLKNAVQAYQNKILFHLENNPSSFCRTSHLIHNNPGGRNSTVPPKQKECYWKYDTIRALMLSAVATVWVGNYCYQPRGVRQKRHVHTVDTKKEEGEGTLTRLALKSA